MVCCSFGSPIKSMVQRRNSINERKRANSGSGTEDEARPSVRQLSLMPGDNALEVPRWSNGCGSMTGYANARILAQYVQVRGNLGSV